MAMVYRSDISEPPASQGLVGGSWLPALGGAKVLSSFTNLLRNSDTFVEQQISVFPLTLAQNDCGGSRTRPVDFKPDVFHEAWSSNDVCKPAAYHGAVQSIHGMKVGLNRRKQLMKESKI